MTEDLHTLTKGELIELVEDLRFQLADLTTAGEHTEGLTRLQGRMVAYLRSRAGVICSKEQVLTAIYFDRSIDEIPEIKVIDVLLMKLRRRRPDIVIETVWGQGLRYVKENDL